jgi:hypothetical protein
MITRSNIIDSIINHLKSNFTWNGETVHYTRSVGAIDLLPTMQFSYDGAMDFDKQSQTEQDYIITAPIQIRFFCDYSGRDDTQILENGANEIIKKLSQTIGIDELTRISNNDVEWLTIESISISNDIKETEKTGRSELLIDLLIRFYSEY